MMESLVPMVVASFVSGVTGSLMGALVVVVSLKTDMRWVKNQVEVLHSRVSNVNQKLDDTREHVFRNLP